MLGESLAIQLADKDLELEVFTKADELTKHPSLVIWSLDSLEALPAIQIELQRLQRHWQPAPVLLVLPAQVRISAPELLQLECPGLLQAPDLKTLKEAISTLINGGRVVRLKDPATSVAFPKQMPMGLGQWLLISALQQINNDLHRLNVLLNKKKNRSPFTVQYLKGRRRELTSAKAFVLWLWGPLKEESPFQVFTRTSNLVSDQGIQRLVLNGYNTNITLRERNAKGVWLAIKERMKKHFQQDLRNATGNILAIESLNAPRRRELLLEILNQLDQVIKSLRDKNNLDKPLKQSWSELQLEIRQQALRRISGNYLQIPKGADMNPVAEQLLELTELEQIDDEIPASERMLEPLLLNKPVLIEGQLLPSDDPRALIHLEVFISNWLIRTAEIISAEVLGACGEWPELRRYMLNPSLISTRELERFRNQLNSQARWQNLVQRPIRLYESKRLLYRIIQGKIEPLTITEPRDEELRQLGWWQQQVALLIEARDALAPQIQSVVKHLGDLMVVLLTQVLGRAIGLVGRGIAQGMGRSLGRG